MLAILTTFLFVALLDFEFWAINSSGFRSITRAPLCLCVIFSFPVVCALPSEFSTLCFFNSKLKGPSAWYFRFVQRTRYLELGKNHDEIFFWAEAVILSQLARDCSAWSCSLDEIAVNANESFREWAFVLFLPRTSNNLSQTRRWACQECHKSSRKLGREDRWFLDFDCKTLIFHLRLWMWDFDCETLIARLWL